jgi:hypothetical protein
MNQRIKELAREAGLLAYNPEGPPTKLEKFAELIVRECVMKAIGAKIRGESIDVLIDTIKKDFGVE